KIYLDLSRQEKGRSYYTKRSDARMQTLAEKYPASPYAAQAQLIEGQKYQDAQDWLKAAENYQKLKPGSAGYEEGLLGAGTCYLQHATNLLKEKKSDEAKIYLSNAETGLKKALAEIEKKSTATLDRDLLARLGSQAFGAKTTLASLYLLNEVNRESEIFPLFEGADDKYAQEPDKLAIVWKFRIRALQQQGKLDEAIGLLEALIQKNPNTKNIGAAAGALARTLDQRATEAFAKDPQSKQGNDFWEKAARYYVLSVKGQLKGDEIAKPTELAEVADRLYVLGLHFNGVPDNMDSFLGWKGEAKRAAETWQPATEMYVAALATTPSYRTEINLARTYGFLHRWKEASQVYASLFDQEPLINKATGKFNGPTIAAKPQLLSAYLEWGVAEHQTALAENDKDRFIRAFGIFDVMLKNTETDSKLWWQSKYYQVRNLVDRGEYDTATVVIGSVERTTNDYDQGKYGFKALFLEMKAELSKKNFPASKAGMAPAGTNNDKEKKPNNDRDKKQNNDEDNKPH
ncbi:MAG: hypothetical protein HYR85_10570, partial [Planctomycetes bacterium]|nr:hypothetical protein [Planctomycetota bacterium]